MTAVDVASILKISTVIVPPYPGITSALGLLTTDLKDDFVKTTLSIASEDSVKPSGHRYARSFRRGQRATRCRWIAKEQRHFEYAVDVR